MRKTGRTRLLSVVLGVIVVATLLFAGCTGGAASPAPQAPAEKAPAAKAPAVSSAPIELTFNSVWPDEMIGGKAQKEWAQEVTKRTNGQVKITYYPAGQLYDYQRSEGAVASGELDLAQFGGFTVVLSSKSIGLPFMFDNFDQVKEFVRGGGMDLINKEAAASNMKALWATPYSTLGMVLRKPIRTLDDAKGMKLRAPVAPMIEFLGQVGASNVTVATGEVYQALQLGTIDGVMSTVETFVARKWVEPADYFLDNVFGMEAHLVMVNLKKWNSLSPDVQKIMLDAGKESEDKLFQIAAQNDKETREKLRSMSKTSYSMPPNEMKRWSEKAGPVWTKWAQGGPVYVEALELAKKVTKKQ